ncbi:MAG TPA: hypothetical protein VKR53_03020 [Puia sp.]|nr:hypothetical protein [Puia sp.]
MKKVFVFHLLSKENMNKPFRVCLLPVLPVQGFAKDKKGKGRLQARIEIMVGVAFLGNQSSIVLIPGSIKQIK